MILGSYAEGDHPFPFRTRPLSPSGPMVLRKRESRSLPKLLRKSTARAVLFRNGAEYLDRAGEKAERLYVTRNNQIEAVLLNVEDFERLQAIEETVEHLTVAKLVADSRSVDEVEVDLEALLVEEGLNLNELRRLADED